MKTVRTTKLVTLLMILLMAVSLASCGGGKTEEPVGDDVVSPEDTAVAEEPTEQDNGPKTVDAIDMQVAYEGTGTYYDENEGYDREYTMKGNEAMKFVDYKLFKNKEEGSEAVVLHFQQTYHQEYYDAKGNSIDDLGSDDYAFSVNHFTRIVKNIDTGEEEEIDEDLFDPDLDEWYPGKYDGLIEWLEEINCWDTNEDWYKMNNDVIFYPCNDSGDEVEISDLFSNKDTKDYYSIVVATKPKGQLEFRCENNFVDNDYFDYKLTSYNDAEQVMRIDL